MFSHNGYGPGTKDQGPKADRLGGAWGPAAFGPWALGPGPISIMTDHMCIKGNQLSINRQYITANRSHRVAASRPRWALAFEVRLSWVRRCERDLAQDWQHTTKQTPILLITCRSYNINVAFAFAFAAAAAQLLYRVHWLFYWVGNIVSPPPDSQLITRNLYTKKKGLVFFIWLTNV